MVHGSPQHGPLAGIRMSPVLGATLPPDHFEGLKAYRSVDGSVNIFRPQANIAG